MKENKKEKSLVSTSDTKKRIPPTLKADKREKAKKELSEEKERLYLPAQKEKALPDRNVLGGDSEGEIVKVTGGVDRLMLVLIIILACFGSIMVFSASYADAQSRYNDSYYFIKRQMVFVGLGLGLMCVVMRFPYKFFKFWHIQKVLQKAEAMPEPATAWAVVQLPAPPAPGDGSGNREP